MALKIFALILLIGFATANLHLNIKYRNFVEGSQPLTQRIAEEIYREFQSTNYEKSEYRFKVFYENVKEMAKHNTEGHTWKQGINDFSDMTFEEFTSEKLMAPQNCSATSFLKIKKQFKNLAIPDSY